MDIKIFLKLRKIIINYFIEFCYINDIDSNDFRLVKIRILFVLNFLI